MSASLPSLDDDLRSLLRGGHLADPFPIWNALREAQPVHAVDGTIVLSRLADVRRAVNDRRLSNRYYTGSRVRDILDGLPEDVRAQWQEMADFDEHAMVRTDAPVHTRLRDCPAPQPSYLSTRERGAGQGCHRWLLE